jgi:hypothetical protein
VKVRRGRYISTADLGYGSEHQRLRKEWAKVVDAGRAHCWRCGRWLVPGLPWCLGHNDFDRSVYMGPECPKCNYGTPGKRRARKQRRPQSQVW